MDKKIQELDDAYRAQLDGTNSDESVEKTFWQRRATDFCNNAAFVTFAVSIVFFICYISSVQTHNYRNLKKQKEDKVMSMKKTAGVTETKAPVAKQIITITEGKTEIRAAIPSPQKVTPLGATEAPRAVPVKVDAAPATRGITDAPAAVPKPPSPPPPTPSASGDSGKK